MNDVKTIIKALRCTSSALPKGHSCQDCPYRVLESVDKRIPAPPDVVIDGELYWESCDCDRIAREASDALERLAGGENDD